MRLTTAAANELRARIQHERQARAEGRVDLLAFTCYTFQDYKINWHHRLTCETLNRFVFGDIHRLIVIQPPRHGKSELVSRRLPAFILGYNPDAEIIAASHTQDLANEMSNDCQSIMEDPRYRALFPAAVLPNLAQPSQRRRRDVQSARKFTVTGRKGSYRCAGVGGSITGKGMMYGIIDDPIKNRKDADSLLKRQEVWGWYQSTFYTRLEKDARILINMTRWHDDDLVGRLLKEAKQEAADNEDPEIWHVLWLPATAEDKPPQELIDNPQVRLIGPDPRLPGEALWPDKYPVERLNRISKAMGGRSGRNWTALYQGRPRQEDGEIFRASMLNLAVNARTEWEMPNGRKIQKADCFKFSTVDLATSESTQADYTVVGTFYGHPGTRSLILADLVREHITGGIHELVIESQRVKHGAAFTAIEKQFFGLELIQIMRRKGRPIRELDADRDKFARAYGVLYFFEGGDFYIAHDCPQRDVVVDELLKFRPGCTFDDIVDVVVYGATTWSRATYAHAFSTAAERGVTLPPERRQEVLRQIRPPRPRQ